MAYQLQKAPHQTTSIHEALISCMKQNTTLAFFSIKLFSRAILGYEYFLFFIFFSEQVLISLMLSYADSHVSLFMWNFALSAFT